MYRKLLSFIVLFLLLRPAAADDSFSLGFFVVVNNAANTVLSPDGQTVAVFEDAAYNNNEVDPALLPIHLVNLNDGTEKMTLTEGITDYTTSAAFSSDSSILAAEQENGLLTIWDTTTGKLLNTFSNTIGSHLLAFVPGTKNLLDATNTITLLWNSENGIIYGMYTPHYDTYAEFQAQFQNVPIPFVVGLAPLPDGTSFVTLSTNGALTLHNVDDAKETILLPAFTDSADTYRRSSLAFTPDGKYLLYGDFKDKQIHVVDMSMQQDIHQIDVASVPTSHFFAVAPDNDTLAVVEPGAESGDLAMVHLYSLSTGRRLFNFPLPTKLRGRYQIAFTPDGHQLVISGFWDTSHSGHNIVYIATLGA